MRHQVVTFSVPNPAAGADWAFMPSESDRVRLLAVTAKLTTSAAAANRRPAIAYTSQTALGLFSADAQYPQAASLAVTYSWAYGAGLNVPTAVITAERISAPLPDMRLEPGDKVSSSTLAIDVADQWSLIAYRAIVGESWEQLEEIAAALAAIRGSVG